MHLVVAVLAAAALSAHALMDEPARPGDTASHARYSGMWCEDAMPGELYTDMYRVARVGWIGYAAWSGNAVYERRGNTERYLCRYRPAPSAEMLIVDDVEWCAKLWRKLHDDFVACRDPIHVEASAVAHEWIH